MHPTTPSVVRQRKNTLRTPRGFQSILAIHATLLIIWATVTVVVPLVALSVSIPTNAQYTLGLTFERGGFVYDTNVHSLEKILSFLPLFLPRLLLILGLIHFLRQRPLPLVSLNLLFLAVLWITSYALNLYYLTATVMLLTSAHIGSRFSAPDASLIAFAVVCLIYLMVLIVLDVPRGSMLMALVPLSLYLFSKPLWQWILFASGAALILGIQTLIKFNSWDPIWLFNIFYRLGSYGQYVAYASAPADLFNTGRPLAEDFFQSLPLVRGAGSLLDETQLFAILTEGSRGGFAVSPELRAFSYWQNPAIAFVDISITYLSLYLMIWATALLLPTFRTGVLLALPIILQFDSVNSGAYFLQVVIVVFVLLALNRMITRPLNRPVVRRG
jgi:hypothetical protein